MVLGMMVIISLVGSGLLGVAGSGRTDTVHREQSLQCFWGAESALAVARQRLYTDAAFRNSPSPVGLTNGNVVARANVARSGNTYSISVVSTNTLNRITRSLSQDFSVVAYDYWDDFALFAGAGGISMSQSVAIYGDVYNEGSIRMSQSAAIFESLFCVGNVSMSQSAAIYNEAFIGGSISLGGSSIVFGGSYPFSSPSNPYYLVGPTVPNLDPAFYDAYLAQASLTDSGLNFNNSINLAGQVMYVRGGATLGRNLSLTSSPGGGVLVVRDTFTILQNVVVGPNVTIICGLDFDMKQSTQVGTNSLVYAERDIHMKQTGIVAQRAALVAGRDVNMTQAAAVSGFVYAGRDLELSQSTAISGLSYAGNETRLSQTVQLHYTPSALPWGTPPGIQTEEAVQIVPSRWREM